MKYPCVTIYDHQLLGLQIQNETLEETSKNIKLLESTYSITLKVYNIFDSNSYYITCISYHQPPTSSASCFSSLLEYTSSHYYYKNTFARGNSYKGHSNLGFWRVTSALQLCQLGDYKSSSFFSYY